MTRELIRNTILSMKISDEEREYVRSKSSEYKTSIPNIVLLSLYTYFKDYDKSNDILRRRFDKKEELEDDNTERQDRDSKTDN